MVAGMGHTAPQPTVCTLQDKLAWHEVTLRGRSMGLRGPPAHPPTRLAFPRTLTEALAGVHRPAGGVANGSLKAVMLFGELLNGFLQVGALLLLIIQSLLPSPAVNLR